MSPYTRGAQILLDLAVYMGAAWLAYAFRYEAGFLDFYRRQMWLYIAFIPLLRVVVNRCLGIYDMMWRYVTLDDASYLAAALAPVSMLLFGLRLGLPTSSWKPAMLLVPLSIITLGILAGPECRPGIALFAPRALYAAPPLPTPSRRSAPRPDSRRWSTGIDDRP